MSQLKRMGTGLEQARLWHWLDRTELNTRIVVSSSQSVSMGILATGSDGCDYDTSKACTKPFRAARINKQKTNLVYQRTVKSDLISNQHMDIIRFACVKFFGKSTTHHRLAHVADIAGSKLSIIRIPNSRTCMLVFNSFATSHRKFQRLLLTKISLPANAYSQSNLVLEDKFHDMQHMNSNPHIDTLSYVNRHRLAERSFCRMIST